MKSVKNIGLVLAIFVVLMLVLIQQNSTKAEKYPSILSTVEANVPEIVVPNGDAQIASQNQANADDVEKMIGAWKSKKMKSGQWLHIVDNVMSEEDSGVVLPNGQPMPLSYIQDNWYYVNKDGLVEKGVFSAKDANGNIIQQSAYQNNIMINLTFDFRQEGQQPFPLKLDYGYMSQINNAKKLGLEIQKSEENKKGKSRIVSFYTEILKKPTLIGNQKIPVKSTTVKAYFDKASGDFMQTETIYILENGEEVLFERTELISIDVSPKAPAEILAVLDGVK